MKTSTAMSSPVCGRLPPLPEELEEEVPDEVDPLPLPLPVPLELPLLGEPPLPEPLAACTITVPFMFGWIVQM